MVLKSKISFVVVALWSLCSPLQPLLDSPLLDNLLVIYTNIVVAHTCFLSFCLHRIYFSPTKMYSFLTNVQYIHQNIYFPARYTICRKMYIYMKMYNWSTMNYNIPTIFPPKCAIFTLNLKILKGTDFCFCSTSTVCGARDLYQVCCRVYIIKWQSSHSISSVIEKLLPDVEHNLVCLTFDTLPLQFIAAKAQRLIWTHSTQK